MVLRRVTLPLVCIRGKHCRVVPRVWERAGKSLAHPVDETRKGWVTGQNATATRASEDPKRQSIGLGYKVSDVGEGRISDHDETVAA